MIQKEQPKINKKSQKWYLLEAKTLTEVIKNKPRFHINGHLAMFQKGMRRLSVTKVNRARSFPRNYRSYSGIIEVYISYQTDEELDQIVQKLFVTRQIGLLKSEGYGQLRWLGGQQSKTGPPKRWFKPIYRIRKDLTWQLPPHVRELIRYGFLHDMVHTNMHRSKIYVEVDVSEAYKSYLRDHHQNIRQSALISTFQYYDRKAAGATRRHKSPRPDRYNWKWFNTTPKFKQKNIDFKQLATELRQVAMDTKQLYAYVYKSKSLGLLVESMDFGHSALREHLLLIANMIMTDYFKMPERFDTLKGEVVEPLYVNSVL